MSYVDAEDMVKAWLLTTSVAGLVSNKVFMAMPVKSVVPSVILSRVGGAPVRGSDVPVDEPRISFDCWGANRPQAKAIAKALVSEIDDLALTGRFTSTAVGGRLEVGEIIDWIWFPDPNSDTPRYVVDAVFTVLAL